MTLQIALAAAALVLGLAGFVKWRQAARRLERLAESYWELRYEVGQLRSRLDRLEGAAADAAPAARTATSFVPLSSLKR